MHLNPENKIIKLIDKRIKVNKNYSPIINNSTLTHINSKTSIL